MYEPILVFNKKLNLHLSFVMNNLSVLPRIIFSLIKLSRVVEHEAIDIQVTQGQKLDVLSSGSFHLRGRRTSLRFYLWSSYYITWSDRDNPRALLSTLYSSSTTRVQFMTAFYTMRSRRRILTTYRRVILYFISYAFAVQYFYYFPISSGHCLCFNIYWFPMRKNELRHCILIILIEQDRVITM